MKRHSQLVLFLAIVPLGIVAALEAPSSAAGPDADAVRHSAERVLAESGVDRGLIVHVPCGNGRLTTALGSGQGRIVHGLDADPENVARTRRHADDCGLGGTVSAACWSGGRLPYADNLVNLLVVEQSGGVTEEEALRVLVPGGVACWGQPDGRWRKTVKPWPDGLDGWSHWGHGADRNPVSQDARVGPPRRLQWTDGPAWSKKHWGPRQSAMVTAGGRLFIVEDRTPTSLFDIADRWILIAHDAFNGVVLWQRDLPDWTGKGWGRVVRRGEAPQVPEGLTLGVYGELGGGGGVRDAGRVMVADGDRLYVPLSADAPLTALDAATGKVLHTYEGVAPVREIACADGTLLIGGRGRLRAVDPESGALQWERPGGSFCASQGRVLLVGPGGRSVECVALSDGRPLWETGIARAVAETGGPPEVDEPTFSDTLQAGAGIVLAYFREGKRSSQAVAVSAESGRPLWRRRFGGEPFGRGSGPFFIDGLIWSLDSAKGVLLALDPQTGEQERQVPAPAIRYAGHHPRCYYARATCRFIIAKERGADFVDLRSGEVSWNNWVRGPCRRGVLPANGLLYAGPHSCRCYTETALHGFWALAPGDLEEGGTQGNRPDPPPLQGPRLYRGPAYGEAASPSPPPDGDGREWPTYRHDRARSGSTPQDVPRRLLPKWSLNLGCRPTAPVVAGGNVYVAATDRHAVWAVDAASGEPAWRFFAGGRIDSPPTVHEGLVLFGCRDGWVYCLRAEDGRLAWRFRAAPDDRLVGASGQIESAWPVPGSILVRGGVAYCTSGRSSFLDGGLDLHALDPRTGELLHTRHLEGPRPGPEVGTSPETPNRGYVIPGALPDVLVADAQYVYLRQWRFDPALETMEDQQPNFYPSPELSGENRGGDHKFWDNLLEADRHALFSDPAWFHRSYFQNFPGLRLYAATGLLDDAWHRRMYWAYGQVVGQYVVFRDDVGYAVQVFATSPREGGFNAGDGYVVYAGRTARREAGGEKLFALRPDQSLWRIRVPLRPVAMVLAGETLLVAGPPDLDDPREGLAAVEGRRKGVLWSLSAGTGRKLAACSLDAPPVFDGMAVAGRCVLMSTMDGRVVCLGEE